MKSKIFTLIISLMASFFFTSCATILRGAKTDIKIPITGTPLGARVYINDELIGNTPLNYEAQKRKKKIVRIEKEGYQVFNTLIKTKLNAGWTTLSILGGAWPFIFIPTIIDFGNGSICDIKTKSINYTLDSIKVFPIEIIPETNSKIDSQNSINNSQLNSSIHSGAINHPALYLSTHTRELILSPNSAVNIKMKNGHLYHSYIKEIGGDYLMLNNVKNKILYSDITKFRVYHFKRWFPVVFFFLTGPIEPIYWVASSKVVETKSNKCKRQLVELQVINYLKRNVYGNVKCD